MKAPRYSRLLFSWDFGILNCLGAVWVRTKYVLADVNPMQKFSPGYVLHLPSSIQPDKFAWKYYFIQGRLPHTFTLHFCDNSRISTHLEWTLAVLKLIGPHGISFGEAHFRPLDAQKDGDSISEGDVWRSGRWMSETDKEMKHNKFYM